MMIDVMVATLTDRSASVTWASLPKISLPKWNITREDQDAFAAESHRRAASQIAAGHFKSQIVPIVKQTRKGAKWCSTTDEHVKAKHHDRNAGQNEAGVQERRTR